MLGIANNEGASSPQAKNTAKNLNASFLGHALVTNFGQSNSTVVNVIAEKEQYNEYAGLLQNLQFLGAARVIDITAVPDEYRPRFEALGEDERNVYYLHEPTNNILVTQWLNGPLRINDPQDIQICPAGAKPQRFTQTGTVADRYDCAAADHVSLLEQIKEAQKTKVPLLEQINKRAKTVGTVALKLLNPGLREDGHKTALLMQFDGGEHESLLLMKKSPAQKAGVITVDKTRKVALLAEEVQASSPAEKEQLNRLNAQRAALNLAPAALLKLTAQPLLMGEELKDFLDNLATQYPQEQFANGLPAKLINQELDKGICLNKELPITAVRTNPAGEGLLFETLEGVAFSSHSDLSQKRLVTVSSEYWRARGIDSDNREEVL
ncbi:MAG: hypothetical protein ACRC1U_02710, partial [Vibrionaceae bacterium]